ncbi:MULTISPECIES: hypothetical protein [unclassified Coleofasciculus]|nr:MULTISPECIES: hypothetical protein [unclassified Coleofasciculus]
MSVSSPLTIVRSLFPHAILKAYEFWVSTLSPTYGRDAITLN